MLDDGSADVRPPAPLTTGRLVKILRRQWPLIVLCGILALVAAGAYAVTRPKLYGSHSLVSLGTPPVTSQTQATSSNLPLLPDPTAEAFSPSVVLAAARAAGVSPSNVHISVSVTGDSSEALIAVSAASPSQAESMANAAGSAFVTKRQADLVGEAAAQQPQLNKFQNQLQRLEDGRSPTGSNITTPAGSLQSPVATQIQVISALYQSLYSQTVQLDAMSSSVAVISPATPAALEAGSKKKTLGIGLGAGLLVGFGLALILDRSSDQFSEISEIAELDDVRVLGTLGWSKRRTDQLIESPSSLALVEDVRAVRTALQIAGMGQTPETILVASPDPADGKSFVAANLAKSWAQSGVSTILVSSDLRRRTLDTAFSIDKSAGGLAALLEEDSSASSVETDESRPVKSMLVVTQIPRLSFLPAGTPSPYVTDLLASERMAKTVAALKEYADVIIFDSPAFTEVADALALSSHVDAVILVLSSRHTRRASVRHALKVLRQGSVPIVGCVVNRGNGSRRRGRPLHQRRRRPG